MSTPEETPQNRKETSEISDLTEEIRQLVGKLDAPKRKNIWEIFPVLTTFMGTVVLAAISLYVTQSYQRQEAKRTHDFQEAEAARQAQFTKAQIETQRAQMRVEELKALTALAPLLASRDVHTRETAKQMLQAVRASGASNAGASNIGASNGDTANPGAANIGASNSGTSAVTVNRGNAGSTSVSPGSVNRGSSFASASLLDHFVDIALSPNASAQDRAEALQKTAEIASRTNSRAVRNRVADTALKVVSSADAPAEVKKAAADVLAKIRRVTGEEAAQTIASEPLTRKVSQVILHDAGFPASRYKGAETIFAIANRQANLQGFRGRIGWHFAIAADGAIWLGTPLNEAAVHTRRQQYTSISIMLLMAGDNELPTNAQRASLQTVLRALFSRLKIEATADAPEGIGFHFHRDYDPIETCPGKLITKELVLAGL